MNYRYTRISKGVNLLIDFLILNFSLYTTLVLETGLAVGDKFPAIYRGDFLLLNLIWFYCGSINKLYEDIYKRDAVPTIRLTIRSLGIYILLALLLKLVLIQFDFTNQFLVYSFLIFAFLLLLWKGVFLLIRRPNRWSLIRYKKVVIVGAGPLGRDLNDHLTKHRQYGYQMVGFFDDNLQLSEQGLPIIGQVKDCLAYVEENNIAEVYCALPDVAQEKILCLMREADRRMIRFRLVPDVKDYFKKNFMVEMYGHLPVLTPRKEPLEDKANEMTKRAFDIIFSTLVLVFFLSWFIPLMAIIIKLDSSGPVFFRQLRSGKDNEPFYCLKFRSMTVNNDADSVQASRRDARITKVGAFIRKTSIDELPQFLNVLMGDMSVVGPRPHMLKHTSDYSELIEKFMVRHFLIPGITGWAQVNGLRGETKDSLYMEKRVEADIWYLENWSFLLDMKIIVLTVWQSVRGNKNAF
ncbi:undecaprenyl-phosphate glucose phosphotransferase [Pontibacter sp. H259]|uniref:undecaprenyl-phosphate glucose phosphotransferase n=1 Tax=Pontibacter sp. H259 TaxID=3133421 RepID=UPI0030C0525F